MKKIIMLLGVFIIGILTLSSNKIVKSDNKLIITESYTDYIDALTYLEQEIKVERDNGNLIPYEGEWKNLFDRVEELYNIALDESESGPFLTPPALPKTCWFCVCASWMCGLYNQCGCVYSIRCQSECVWCGCPIVTAFTDGYPCTLMECFYPCIN